MAKFLPIGAEYHIRGHGWLDPSSQRYPSAWVSRNGLSILKAGLRTMPCPPRVEQPGSLVHMA